MTFSYLHIFNIPGTAKAALETLLLVKLFGILWSSLLVKKNFAYLRH